ncbi:MAG: hypothetical protein U0640_00600 [Phycisphaerales bacterium]
MKAKARVASTITLLAVVIASLAMIYLINRPRVSTLTIDDQGNAILSDRSSEIVKHFSSPLRKQTVTIQMPGEAPFDFYVESSYCLSSSGRSIANRIVLHGTSQNKADTCKQLQQIIESLTKSHKHTFQSAYTAQMWCDSNENDLLGTTQFTRGSEPPFACVSIGGTDIGAFSITIDVTLRYE